MRNTAFKLSAVMILFLIFALSIYAQEKVSKTFPAKKLVELSTTSGDCIIQKGPADKITVVVEYTVRPADAFTPEMEERSDRIKLSEDWSGSSSGKVLWTVTVPPEAEIDVESASGDISVSGLSSDIEVSTASGDVTLKMCKGDIEASTASGDIDLENVEGDLEISVASGDIKATDLKGSFEFNTASGDMEVKNAKGEFDLNCASGDIEVEKVELDAESEFSAASGDISVSLARSAEYDLELSAASGDVTLEYSGNSLKGRFEMIARHNGSRISAPVAFDSEETFERHGREYDKKIITRSGNKPLISLESASGKVTLK